MTDALRETREWRVHVYSEVGRLDYYSEHFDFESLAEKRRLKECGKWGCRPACTIESRPVGEWTAEGGEATARKEEA